MFVRQTILASAALAAAAFATFGAAGPALAEQAAVVTVSYADLNLAARAGRDVLDARIARAASLLCGEFGPLELTFQAAAADCLDATIASAQEQRDAAVGLRGTVQISDASNYVSVSRAAN